MDPGAREVPTPTGTVGDQDGQPSTETTGTVEQDLLPLDSAEKPVRFVWMPWAGDVVYVYNWKYPTRTGFCQFNSKCE
jgi:hypothetical protein